jgi:hypothetical protein
MNGRQTYGKLKETIFEKKVETDLKLLYIVRLKRTTKSKIDPVINKTTAIFTFRK